MGHECAKWSRELAIVLHDSHLQSFKLHDNLSLGCSICSPRKRREVTFQGPLSAIIRWWVLVRTKVFAILSQLWFLRKCEETASCRKRLCMVIVLGCRVTSRPAWATLGSASNEWMNEWSTCRHEIMVRFGSMCLGRRSAHSFKRTCYEKETLNYIRNTNECKVWATKWIAQQHIEWATAHPRHLVVSNSLQLTFKVHHGLPRFQTQLWFVWVLELWICWRV